MADVDPERPGVSGADLGSEQRRASAWTAGIPTSSPNEPDPGKPAWSTDASLDELTRDLVSKSASSAAALELIRDRVIIRSSGLSEDAYRALDPKIKKALIDQTYRSLAYEGPYESRRARIARVMIVFAAVVILAVTAVTFIVGNDHHSLVTALGVGLGSLTTALSAFITFWLSSDELKPVQSLKRIFRSVRHSSKTQ